MADRPPERVAAKGEGVALHPVLAEFQALIDSDPVVRMYLSAMIVQVPRNRQYRKRQLESVPQMNGDPATVRPATSPGASPL